MVIALLGFGVVGRGVYEIITNDFPEYLIKYILVKDEKLQREIKASFCFDFFEILDDDEVETIIEVIGGLSPAKEFVEKALSKGKNVITANKALISRYYFQLQEIAKKKGCNLLFEASVGGGINFIDSLRNITKYNKIYQIEGIINGSTNYILTKIFKDKQGLNESYEQAFQLGYIERESEDDIIGLDLLRKINILSMIGYDQIIEEKSIYRFSLKNLSMNIINFLRDKDLIIKYLARSRLKDGMMEIYVIPIVIDDSNNYFNIDYEVNRIELYGVYHHKQSYIGFGAGRFPTASAVVADLLRVNNIEYLNFSNQYLVNKESFKYNYLVEENNKIRIVKGKSLVEMINDKSFQFIALIETSFLE